MALGEERLCQRREAKDDFEKHGDGPQPGLSANNEKMFSRHASTDRAADPGKEDVTKDNEKENELQRQSD